jgi:sugar lactone lactonase YvrE
MLELAVLAMSAIQFPWGREAVDPATYASPAGAWEFRVDPSSPSGSGGARYRMLHHGEEAWSARIGVTLLDARVTDAGRIVGYALSKGWSGVGSLHVVVLAPDGEVLLDEAHERQATRVMHGTPDPKPRDLMMLPGADVCVLRVHDPAVDERSESWWTYRVSTGEPLTRRLPADALDGEAEDVRSIVYGAAPLDGADLVLAWGFVDHVGSTYDEQWFALFDVQGGVAWSLVDRGAFTATVGGVTRYDLLERVRESGAVLSTGPDGAFRLWRVALAAAVDYRVVHEPAVEHGWRVDELARAEDQGVPEERAPCGPERVELPHVSAVPLQRAAPSSVPELGPVEAWAFDDAGGLRVVRSLEPRGFESLRVDAAGTVIATTPFEPLPQDLVGPWRWLHLGGDRWLLTVSPYGEGAAAHAFFAHGATGGLRPIEGFTCPSVEAGAGTADGGFVLLATHHFQYTSAQVLIAFDASGREVWRHESGPGYADEPDEFLSPEDVAVLADGTIVVVDNVSDELKVFRAGGSFVENVDLARAWGRDLTYPSGLTNAPDDGLLLFDFGGSPPVNVLNRDGSLRTTLEPVRADGHAEPSLGRQARFAPDGALWTCDGHRFYRLDATGREVAAVGAPPARERLHDVGASAIDRLGRICVQDERNGVLHVWNADGGKLLTAAPEPTDFERVSTLTRIVAGPHGGFVVEIERDHLRFDAQGRRLGLLGERADVDYLPGTDRAWRWNGGRFGVEVLTGDEVVARVKRLPSERWATDPEDVFPFDDGSFALLADGEVGLYGPAGEPRASFVLPSADDPWGPGPITPACLKAVHASARWILVSGFLPGAWLINREGGSIRAFFPPEIGENGTVEMALSPDGAEVWVLDEQELVLHRYALPR